MSAAAYLLLVLAGLALASAGATVGSLSPVGIVLSFTGGALGAGAVMLAYRAGRAGR